MKVILKISVILLLDILVTPQNPKNIQFLDFGKFEMMTFLKIEGMTQIFIFFMKSTHKGDSNYNKRDDFNFPNRHVLFSQLYHTCCHIVMFGIFICKSIRHAGGNPNYMD